VIYRIDEQHHRVNVLAIEHRADVYRPRQSMRPPLATRDARAQGTYDAVGVKVIVVT
jgi:hypothetical protein